MGKPMLIAKALSGFFHSICFLLIIFFKLILRQKNEKELFISYLRFLAIYLFTKISKQKHPTLHCWV